ncbi:MAG: UDP-N-acetylmuramate--L-alanine ligase [Candidatus Omnitrophota bacterium]
MLGKKKNIHFVGVGGIGMSAVAQVLMEMGHNVSGSDVERSHITRRLETMGGRMYAGHRSSNLPRGTDILVYSSSITEDNPEIREGRRRKTEIIHRARMLGEIFNGKKGIAVSGTHGKTTTTSFISVMLESARLDPTVIIGGEVSCFNGNAKLGKGPYAVAEADESDGSFVHLKPLYGVITNMEMEHLDYFKSLSHIHRSYRAFIDNIKGGGTVFYNHDDLNTKIALKGYRRKSASFGFSEDADIYPINIKMEGFDTSFGCVYKHKVLGTVHLRIPGRHNILNAMAAILVGLRIGIAFKNIARALGDFDGAKRRFQLRADAGGVMLIDDYAHHPTEIKAVLDACRNWDGKRIIAIFQPHRYSRTKFLAEQFGRCFRGVDKLILTDIYAASEKAIKGVSIMNIYDKAKASGMKDIRVMKKDLIPEYVMRVKRPGDMILVLGAGDVKAVADRLSDMLVSLKLRERSSMSGARSAAELRKKIRGRILQGEKLSRRTSFGIGGPAKIWIEPADTGDLRRALSFVRERRMPVFVIGNGSNVLASDKGFDGMLIHLGSEPFKRIGIGAGGVTVGAGFSLPKLVRIACENGLGGLESLVGIPGTVGGAIYMNAGGHKNPAYRNIGEFVRSLKVMDHNGRIKTLKGKDVVFGYRSSNLDRYIVLEAKLALDRSDKAVLVSSCRGFLKIKMDKQVLDKPSAGCMFKNPGGFQFTCGQMIDMLKFKGKKIGGAEVSRKHANFIINSGGAVCEDVLKLADFIRGKVKESYGIDLEMEVKLI